MVIVYLSPVPWDSIAQRPHFFVKYLLEKKNVNKILWVNPTPSRLPRWSDFKTRLFNKLEPNSIDSIAGLEIIDSGLFFPVEPLSYLYNTLNFINLKRLTKKVKEHLKNETDTILIQGKPSHFAQYICSKITFRKRIADIMDDFPYFFTGISKVSMRNLLELTLTECDEIIFSSQHIADKYAHYCKKYKIINNACSEELLINLKNCKNKQNNDKIVYGYIGNINTWFNWDFVIKLAMAKSESLIRLIGPCYVSPPKLPNNIHIENAIEHKKVAQTLKEFDFGLIPFKINELTESVDPVKYYEYIAAGLPVISSYFGEMKNRIDNKYAFSLESYLNNQSIFQDTPITWSERFKEINL